MASQGREGEGGDDGGNRVGLWRLDWERGARAVFPTGE